MSQQKDHTSEEAEADDSADNHNNEQSKTDVSMLNNELEAPMLEDEEMPTYISVSSSSRRNDSDVCNAKQEERVSMEEDRSPNSICVLSSVEDSDCYDSNEDSNDMYEMDAADRRAMRSRGALLDDEEEEDEDDNNEENPLKLPTDDEDESDFDENSLRMSHEDDDDDDIDEDYEPRCSDRASDDFVLNNRLKPCHKERSLSLQDLTVCKNNVRSPRDKKRLRLNFMRQNYFGLQQNPAVYPVIHRKQSMPLRYQHVESKVKRYITDIKERSKRSLEKRFKDEQHVTLENHMEDENNDAEHLAPMATSKNIKDYVEKAIKDLQEDEISEGKLLYNVPQVVENGEANKLDEKLADNQYKHARLEKDMDIYCKSIQKEKNHKNRDDRQEKRNGSLDVHYGQYPGAADRNIRFNVMHQSTLANGHQPALSNIHSVTYEEYMHSDSNVDGKNELPEQEQPEDVEIINIPEIDNSSASCPLKIENVKSIRMSDESESSNFMKTCQVGKSGEENVEIDHLKIRLTQKTAQYDSLRDAYQKTLAENISMKQELEALKKTLAKYESENKSCETKVVSVQTEIPEMPIVNQAGATKVKDTDNKASTSSVASTLSSIERWTESDASPAISIKPPDLTAVLNSDDSSMFTNGTPRKTAHAISRTFLTSSRILQTLSNITQGKTKSESPLVRNPKKRSNDKSNDDSLFKADHNSSMQASSSKKRKATDMLGTSNAVQPFKIPHTIINCEKKSRTNSTDAEFNFTNEHTNSQSKTESDPVVTSETSTENISRTGNNEEEMDDHDDSVKCFVYREDENSVNQSFLIQAEEPTKHTLAREKGRIQECGPYLLGNLEVRMSEINGTISVWGKEISQDPVIENDEEMETSTNTQNKKSSHCWANSPQTRFNGSSMVCSTNKKQKIPGRFNGSHIFNCSHSSPLNAIKSHFLTDDVCDKNCTGSPSSQNARVSTYNCDTANSRQIWQTCKRNSNLQDKIHSCCTHHTTDRECSCGSYQERQTRDDSPNRSRDKCSIKGIRRGSCRHTPDASKHIYEHATNCTAGSTEVFCKYSRGCGHPVENTVENCQQYSKSCNTVRDNSCTCKSSARENTPENTYRNTCNRSPSNHNEEDPLISCTRSNETSEMRQRRLSGKRVRGILMDLLRGCGDCRNTSGGDQSNVKEKETPYLANDPPQIKITSCDKSEPLCSNRTQCSGRFCHTCARRIETQLEEFRMEMERVRTRSDAILDMLSMLHSVDTN